jgi:FkbM family methyltransferase
MKNSLKILIKFLLRFGLYHGIRLACQFLFKNLDAIKLPNFEHTLSLRPDSSDVTLFYEIFLNNEYKLNFIKKADIVVDAGSNIGLFALMVKNEFPNSKLICIEPDSENYKILEKNLKPYENVILINAALWSHETKLRIYDKYNFGNYGLVVEEDDIKGEINAISLDSIIKQYELSEIDVLKIDIETSEKELFSTSNLNWLKIVKVVIIELHDWMERGCSKPFFNAINAQFDSYTYSHHGENVIIVNHDLDK